MRLRLIAVIAWTLVLGLTSFQWARALDVSIAVRPNAIGLALATDVSRLFVGSEGGSAISVVDTGVNAEVSTWTAGSAPGIVARDPRTGKVYASNFNDGTVTVLAADGSTLATVAGGGLGLAVDASKGIVYAAGATTLKAIDAQTDQVLRTISAPSGARWWDVAVNPTLNKLYLTDLSGSRLFVLDATTFETLAAVPMAGELRFGLAVDDARDLVYVPHYAVNGAVSIFDGATNAVIATRAVGSFPFYTSLDVSGSRLFVSEHGSGTVTALRSSDLALLGTTATGGRPAGLAFDAASQRLYVADNANDVNGNGVVRILHGASLPGAAPEPTPTPTPTPTPSPAPTPTPAPTATPSPTPPANAAPVIHALVLSDTTPGTNDQLIASASVSDPNGDPLTLTFTWRVDATVKRITITGATSDTFDLSSPGNGNTGDSVSVTVTVSDGTLSGGPATATATITAPGRDRTPAR